MMKKIIYSVCIAVLFTNNVYSSSIQEKYIFVKKIKTKTGNTITIYKTKDEKRGLYTLKITTIGFSKNIPLLIKDMDPIKDILVGDLDKNGFDEIYIITQNVGSGSYGNLYGYTSIRDKKLEPITIQELKIKGYMGHDNISLSNGKIKRIFPIYKEGDGNCCPSGGNSTIAYRLEGTKLVQAK